MIIPHASVSALSLSLVRALLSIDLFQSPVITCLINRISELGSDETDAPLAISLLNQLRWLDFIVDSHALYESLLSIVPVLCPIMQKALIEALPEILDDASRDPVVTELIRILEESPSMMASVIDALAALGVDDSRLPDVNSAILSSLPAANRDMLPVSLKYLLRTCPPALLTETTSTLRHTLALPSLGPATARLCLDAVRAGLRMSKTIADHLIKTIRNLEKPSDHKPSDLWILIALLDSPLHRKPAETLFRKKAASNLFSRTIIDAALAPFAEAFYGLTNHLLHLSSIAVKSPDVAARRTAVFLFALVFRLFPTGNTRRNVITTLLEHTGTRRPVEIDGALEALVLIAKESETNRSLMPHSASIQGLLDYLEFFTDSQLRQIWTILAFLCRASATKVGKRKETDQAKHDQEDDLGEAELAMLEILLRKELTHSETFYRRIGVIGACTMVKVLGKKVKNNILSMLLDVGRSHPYSQALAFDELAEVFSQPDPITKETVESIHKTISSRFEKKFMSDRAGLGSLVKDEALLPAKMFGNLEGEDVEICFSISSLVRNEPSMKACQDSVRAMVPNLRLLCVMTANQRDGTLSDIDAVIGAPLHLPILPKNYDMDDMNMRSKSDLLLSLFVGHGWIVELINGFAGQESAELRAKCVKRIDNLLEVTSMISTVIPQVPVWRDVLFDSYCGTRGNPAELDSAPFGIKAGPASKRKRNSKENRPTSGQGIRCIQAWKGYARQLSASALSLIRTTSPITWRFTETEAEFVREGEPMMETVKLSSEALQYLLTELFSQIDSLVAGLLGNQHAFGASLFRSIGTGSSNPAGNRLVKESTTEGFLKKFNALRTALISLGPQLSRCIGKIFPEEDQEGNEEEDESTLEMHRNCAVLCLKSLALCLNSAILCDPSSQELLFAVLASIRLDGEPSVEASDPLTTADIEAAARTAFEQLQKKMKTIFNVDVPNEERDELSRGPGDLQLEGCCAILAAMDSIFFHCAEKTKKSLGPRFSKISYSILQHSWDVATLRSRKTQKLIPGIVKIYVQCSTDPLDTAENMREKVVVLSDKLAERQKNALVSQDVPPENTQSIGLGSLTEQTCFTFTIAILEQCMWLFKTFKPSSYERAEDAFSRISRFVKAELPLYNLARQNQRVLGPVMRAGRTFVEVFLKTCLPFLKEMYKEHRSEVVRLCKMHQKPSRVLQSFCAHSKSIRDTSLTGLVPPLRKALELLLYRVKDLLQAHNAMDAFQLGNLKHRDINGEVLSSQHLQYKSASEESEYSSAEGTDEDEDERASRGSRKSNTRSQRKADKKSVVTKGNKKRPRLTSGKKRESEEARGTGGKRGKKQRLEEQAQELDFGSDDNEAEGNEERDEVVAISKTARRRPKSKAGSVQQTSKRRKNCIKDDDSDDDAGQSRTKRNPLIDDEAEADDYEEGEDDCGDLSQFLVFGDEEEEE